MLADIYQKRTWAAFMGSRLLRTPFWAIYNILPFILFKDLHATPLQITVVVALKPMASLFSMYWSAAIYRRPDLLVSNIVWASVLGLLPFFFFPFVDNPWFFIFAFGFYMTFHRGVIPAWMEVMKRNLPEEARVRVFAWGTALGYLGDGLLPFLFGFLLDGYFQAWRWIFPLTAFIGLLPIFLQSRILIHTDQSILSTPLFPQSSLVTQLIHPWKQAWELIQMRSDFRAYLGGFIMLGGSGLMVMQAVLPAFFMGVLELSYTEVAVALTLCKGIGVASTSQIWANWMTKVDIYRFSGLVTLMAFLFPLCLVAAPYHISWLYTAYVLYGVMQAGSELSWNLSGPIFSKEEDSSPYSSVNVLSVGIRGCVAPGVGSLLLFWTGPLQALLFGSFLCMMAAFAMYSFSRTQLAEVKFH